MSVQIIKQKFQIIEIDIQGAGSVVKLSKATETDHDEIIGVVLFKDAGTHGHGTFGLKIDGDEIFPDNFHADIVTLNYENKNIVLKDGLWSVHKQGKGSVIRTAIEKSTGEAICIQDADLEYNPKEYKKLLEAYESGYSAVFGSRNLNPRRKGYFHFVIGAKIIDWTVNYLFNSNLTDIYTCYKLINTKVIRSLNLQSRGFEIEAEITAKLLKRRIKIKEVAINYLPRKFSQGKKIRTIDGLKGLWTLIKNKLSKES